MLIWIRDDDLRFLATADNGSPIWAYVCFAPQNEQDLVDLKEFVEAYGCHVEWEHEDEIRQSLEEQKAGVETEKQKVAENISEAELRKMRKTAAQGSEINVYNPETGKWISSDNQ